jgi:hypothetical protein
MDRSIEIPMRRRKPGEHIARFLFARAFAETEGLRRQLARWAADAREAVKVTYLTASLPDGLEDRDAECWAPLFAVARVAVPDRLPELERIARTFTGLKAQADPAVGVRLLYDLWGVYEAHRETRFLPTMSLIEALVAHEDAPWREYRAGRPLTPVGLADLLRPFDITPRQGRYLGKAGLSGYHREAFQDAWSRYAPHISGFESLHPLQPVLNKAERAISDPLQTPLVEGPQTAGKPCAATFVESVDTQNAYRGEGAEVSVAGGAPGGTSIWETDARGFTQQVADGGAEGAEENTPAGVAERDAPAGLDGTVSSGVSAGARQNTAPPPLVTLSPRAQALYWLAHSLDFPAVTIPWKAGVRTVGPGADAWHAFVAVAGGPSLTIAEQRLRSLQKMTQ